jgi:hypothetical protein
VGWHTKSKDIVLFAEVLKFKRVVALMAIKDKKPTRSNYLVLRVPIEVLQPLKSYFVCCPAVVTDCNSLVLGNIFLLILCRQVILACKDQEWRDSRPGCVDSLDGCCPFTVA